MQAFVTKCSLFGTAMEIRKTTFAYNVAELERNSSCREEVENKIHPSRKVVPWYFMFS